MERIIKGEGGSYSDYLCSIFRGYNSYNDKEFFDTIKNEEIKWIQEKLGSSYLYHDFVELGRLTYNNIVNEYHWNTKTVPKFKDAEKIYLALAT